MIIDDEEMIAARDDELREQFVEISRLMLAESQNQGIEDIMTGRGDKRREEGANPKPAQPKARTSWTQQDTRWTKDEPIPKAPPPKANSSPEGDHEPKGPRGRPKSTPASSSTDTPYAKAKAKAEAQRNPEDTETTRGRTKPIKKNVNKKPTHETDLIVLDTVGEWNLKPRGFLVDQLHKRPGIKFSKTDAKKMSKKDMIDKLLRFDGKI